jgi:hypothetical protein
LKNNQQTITTCRQRGLANGALTLPQRKGVRQRNKAPVIKHSENPTPKQDSWWATELILEPGTTYKRKLLHPTEGGAEKAAASERWKKKREKTKHYPTTGKTTTELLLKHQHDDWMLE